MTESAATPAAELKYKVVAEDNAAPIASPDVTIPLQLMVHMPVNARGAALAIIASVALIFALEGAQKFLIPVIIGILIAYTLNPLVAGLERLKCPRVVASMIVVIGVSGLLALGSYSGWGQTQLIVERLPTAVSKMSAVIRGSNSNTMQKVQAAAKEIEKATNQATGARPAATPVVVEQDSFRLNNILWAGWLGAVGFFSQTALVLFLVFFLLASGDTFKRKLVKLTGPSLAKKKITVNILDDINSSIQRYMCVLLTTNMMVGLFSWIAFRLLGLESAGAWSVAAALFHVIPYFGPAVIAVATGMAAFMQFDSSSMAMLVAGSTLLIAVVVGLLITTWMAGKIARMNAAAVFISLLFWAWLWGIWGMLLAIPITVIAKVVSEHVEQLQPVAELLGD